MEVTKEEYDIMTNFFNHKCTIGLYELQNDLFESYDNETIFKKYQTNFVEFWFDLTYQQRKKYLIMVQKYICKLKNISYIEMTIHEQITIIQMTHYLKEETPYNIIKNCYGSDHVEQYYKEKELRLTGLVEGFYFGLDGKSKIKFIKAIKTHDE